MIDYRTLIKKYMNLVSKSEGIYFLDYVYEGECGLTEEEITELKTLSQECLREVK